MNTIQALFPAKARRKVARTDWSRPELVTVAPYDMTVCPIGMALRSCGWNVREPTASYALDVVGSDPEKFNKTAARRIAEDSHEYTVALDEIRQFMRDFDDRQLTNEAIAEAFGYPQLAVS